VGVAQCRGGARQHQPDHHLGRLGPRPPHLHRAHGASARRAHHRRCAPRRVLPTMGGQTVLNLAVSLADSGAARRDGSPGAATWGAHAATVCDQGKKVTWGDTRRRGRMQPPVSGRLWQAGDRCQNIGILGLASRGAMGDRTASNCSSEQMFCRKSAPRRGRRHPNDHPW
jgi:hypothetical protein